MPSKVLNAADIASRSLQLTLHPFLLSNGGNPKIIFQSSLRADSAELHPEGLREEGEGEAGGLLIEAAERDELATTPAVTELSWVNASGDGVEPWVIKAFNSQGVTVLDVVNAVGNFMAQPLKGDALVSRGSTLDDGSFFTGAHVNPLEGSCSVAFDFSRGGRW